MASLVVPGTGLTGTGLAAELLDLGRLGRELDLVTCAVQRQRPGAAQAEIASLVSAVAAELASRHRADGYFPVLVHGAVLARLPDR